MEEGDGEEGGDLGGEGGDPDTALVSGIMVSGGPPLVGNYGGGGCGGWVIHTRRP